MHKDTSQQLSENDTISLLPNEHIYTIKIREQPNEDSDENPKQSSTQDQDETKTAVTNASTATPTEQSKPKTILSSDKETPDKPLSVPREDSQSADTGTGGSTGRVRKLPVWLQGCSTSPLPSSKPPPAKKKAPAPRKKPATDVEPQGIPAIVLVL